MAIITSLYFFCGIIYIVVGLLTFLNDKRNKINVVFLLLCIDIAFWAFMFTLLNSTTSAEAANDLYIYSIFFWAPSCCLLLHFVILLTGKERLFHKRFSFLILYLPALFSICLYLFGLTTAKDVVGTDLGWVVLAPKGLNFYYVYYLSYMAAVVFYLYKWWKNSKIARERKQARLILVTMLVTIFAAGITDIVLPVSGIILMPSMGAILVIIVIIGIWYSIKRYKLMALNPENFGLEVLKIMNEGLIISNHEGIIKFVNTGALKLLGYDKSQLMDKELASIFSEPIDLSKLKNCCSFEIELLQSDNGKLPVLLSSSVLKDEWGDTLGIVGIFQDISEIRQVQQKLINAYDDLEIKVLERTSELRKANIELEHEINTRKAMEDKIKNLAYYDYLTGLPNRRLFYDRLNQGILDAVRNEKILGVLFLDIDSFKRVNDTMGHAKGDELLRLISKRLTGVLRESDTVTRVGGDEFLILIQNLEYESHIRDISEKILEIFKEPFIIDGYDLYVTTSIGGAIYPIDGQNVDALIKNADIAMYRAKDKGKNKFELCTPIIKDSMAEEMKLTNSLYRALERNELELYYQPQVNILSGEIFGLETLIRWNNTERGLVNPADFIYIAEKTGLILPIGEWVMRKACIQNKAWQDAGILNVPVAVNLSVNQFQNTKIVELIAGILKETNLKPSDLELEITENVIMKETEYIIESLKQLKQLGVSIAIDDFGTEYSSLNYLKQLPVDRIKIAMSFVQGINVNAKDEAIINVIMVLARNLGLKVIAEGVETREQLDFLRDQLCNYVQGYYYYKPMPASQLEELMKVHVAPPQVPMFTA